MITKCYTFEVTMLIQVLADDFHTATTTLDNKGGYTSERKVKLVKTTNLADSLKLTK